MGRLDGKVAIITGAARGMGAAHAREFVEEGAKVVITDIREDEGKKLSGDIGENTIFVKHDVTKEEDWENVINKANESFGPVNILVNNAGYGGQPSLLGELESEQYHQIVNIDQHGTFYGMKALIPHMLESGGGSIVNISSVSGLVNKGPNAAYVAAKHAVIGLTKSAAVDYTDKNIRVNAICPGGVLTPLAKETLSPEELEQASAEFPIRRFAEPHEVSKAVVFLASDDSSYISGSEYRVDGGYLS